jgi:DNA-binding MarR family transcriptional regulator
MESHAAVTSMLDDQLRRETGMDLQTYDALLHAYEAGEEGIRMTVLARRVVMSKSGLTALVDRLQARGWFERITDPEDRRAIRIVLTKQGRDVFKSAAVVHLAGIERYFAEYVGEGESRVIAEALERVHEIHTADS